MCPETFSLGIEIVTLIPLSFAFLTTFPSTSHGIFPEGIIEEEGLYVVFLNKLRSGSNGRYLLPYLTWLPSGKGRSRTLFSPSRSKGGNLLSAGLPVSMNACEDTAIRWIPIPFIASSTESISLYWKSTRSKYIS